MKPNFALDLSHDGIRLLHRGKSGWTLVGDVALDDPDMGDQLSMLRGTAASLEAGGFTSKLVIPDSQILYTTLEAPGPDDIGREEQIRAGLDGMTPYPVKDLVFDYVTRGTRVHVAVVARETLDEAEGFAREHRLNPVAFVANPATSDYPGEPLFGPAPSGKTLLGGALVERDELPLPKARPAPAAPAEPAPVDEVEPPAAAPEPEPAYAPEPEPAYEPAYEPAASAPAIPKAPPPLAASRDLPEAARPVLSPFPPIADDGTTQKPEKPVKKRKRRSTARKEPALTRPETADEDTQADEALVLGAVEELPAPDETESEAEAAKTTDESPDTDATDADAPDTDEAPADETAETDAPSDEKVADETAQDTSRDASEADLEVADGETDSDAETSVDETKPDVDADDTPDDTTADADDTSDDAKPDVDEAPDVAISDVDDADAGQEPDVDSDAETADAEPAADETVHETAADADETADELPADADADTPAPGADEAETSEAPESTDADSDTDSDTGTGALKTPAAFTSRRAKPDEAQDATEADAASDDAADDTNTDNPPPRFLGAARRDNETGEAPRIAAIVPGAAPRVGVAGVPPAADAVIPDPDAEEAASGDSALTAGTATDEAKDDTPDLPGPALAPISRSLDAGAPAQPITSASVPAKDESARKREAEALTVFGARKSQGSPRGKPRFLGLFLVLILLLLMAIAAVWSTFFMSGENAGLFNSEPETRFSDALSAGDGAMLGSDPDAVDLAEIEEEPEPEATGEEIAALAPEAATPPAETTGTPGPEPLTEEAAEARYAATGIWQRAPEPPEAPRTAESDDFYIASIDPSITQSDAIALPRPGETIGAAPYAPPPPPAAGSRFTLDDSGRVAPTPEGVLTPDGIVVTAGEPPLTPPARPGGLSPTPEAGTPLPDTRPRPRPTALIENNERANLGGLTLAELGERRPRFRPNDFVPVAALPEGTSAAIDEIVAASSLVNPTALAVPVSRLPTHRPGNIAQIVASAAPVAAPTPTPAAAPAVTNVTPAIPTSASVASAATVSNALNLRNVNLIGVYGSSGSRRALVRMGNGRYVKVEIGDRLDGGQVVSISDDALIYQKNGRNLQLELIPLG